MGFVFGVSRTYGNKNFPLLEGEYDVEINSVRLTRVPVTRGMDTRIHIGTISFNVPSGGSKKVTIADGQVLDF